MIEEYIDALESQLRVAGRRRVRLEAARLPRPPRGSAIAVLSVILCAAVAVALFQTRGMSGGRGRPAGLSPLGVQALLGLPAPGFSGVAPATAGAALADAMRAAAAGPATPALGPDQAWYTSAEEKDTQISRLPGGRSLTPRTQSVQSHDANWISTGSEEHLFFSMPNGRLSGSDNGLAASAAGFGDFEPGPIQPTGNPASVLRALAVRGAGTLDYTVPRRGGRGSVAEPNAGSFTRLAQAAAVLGVEPVRPASRAAIWRALATVPGLEYRSDVRDPLGRRGVAITVTASNLPAFNVTGAQRYTFELIFNPATGTVLGSRTIAAASIPALHVRTGMVLFSWAYRLSRVVRASTIPSSPNSAVVLASRAQRAERQSLNAPGQPCHGHNGLTARCRHATAALEAAIYRDPAVIASQRKLLTPPPTAVPRTRK